MGEAADTEVRPPVAVRTEPYPTKKSRSEIFYNLPIRIARAFGSGP
jgi:hypothetical protein